MVSIQDPADLCSPTTCPEIRKRLDHSVSAGLPVGLDSARLRVRVTLAAGFSECQAAGMSGVANLVAHAKIYDVRVVAQKAPVKPVAKAAAKKPSQPKTP